MSKSIEVIIQPDGSLKIDAVGFTGSDCEQATAFLEDALGQASSRQRKPEYNNTTKRTAFQRTGGRV